jgi:hypothetical protein
VCVCVSGGAHTPACTCADACLSVSFQPLHIFNQSAARHVEFGTSMADKYKPR